MIKDGFLLYFPESERKEFDKRRHLGINPKGAIPLGGCIIDTRREQGHPFSISITSDELGPGSVSSSQ